MIRLCVPGSGEPENCTLNELVAASNLTDPVASAICEIGSHDVASNNKVIAGERKSIVARWVAIMRPLWLMNTGQPGLGKHDG